MATRMSQFRRVEPASVDQRRAERHRVTIDRATMRKHGEVPVEAVLHDLSIYGCRLATEAEHGPETRLWLRLTGSLPIAATVVWSADGFLGCRFDAPIERALVRQLTLSIF